MLLKLVTDVTASSLVRVDHQEYSQVGSGKSAVGPVAHHFESAIFSRGRCSEPRSGRQVATHFAGAVLSALCPFAVSDRTEGGTGSGRRYPLALAGTFVLPARSSGRNFKRPGYGRTL